MLRRERKHFERKSRRFESSNNEDRRQAVIDFFGADPDMVDVSTVSGFSGPVTEITFNGNVYWVMTDSESEREATAHFLDTFTNGSMIEHDPDLRRMAERTDLWNSDAVLDAWLAENDRDDAPDDDDEIYEWVEDNYSISELWDMEVIDREAFCKELWEVYGYGHELDIEGHTESEEVGGVYYNIFLIEGEWKYESKRPAAKTRKRRFESRSEYTMSEKLDMRLQTYCSSVLGISLSALMSSSVTSSITRGFLSYMERILDICDLGDTCESARRYLSVSNIRGFISGDSSEGESLFRATVDNLNRQFGRLSGGVLHVGGGRNSQLGFYPTHVFLSVNLNNDNGTTVWSDNITVPLSLCFEERGPLKLRSEDQLESLIRDTIQEEIDRMSDEWDDARYEISRDMRSEFERRKCRNRGRLNERVESHASKKFLKNEGAGAGMLINVGDLGGSQKVKAFKVNPDGTYTLDVDDVILNDVVIHTSEWSSEDAWDGIKCRLSFTLRYLDADEYERKLQNRLEKLKTQTKRYGVDTYTVDISFGTLACGGGWTHMSLADGFEASAYASDKIYNWRNMGSLGEVTVSWDGDRSGVDSFEIVSVYVDAGKDLERLYQDGEDEWLEDAADAYETRAVRQRRIPQRGRRF